MAKITLYHEQQETATYVPNIFIDEFMTYANGEYVKIYLYLLRCIHQPEPDFSLSQIADHFDCTERDVLRALKYWEKLKLFRLEYNEENGLSGIYFLTGTSQTGDAAVNAQSEGHSEPDAFIQAARTENPKSCSQDQMETFCQRADIQELLFITEKYIGHTLNRNDLDILFFWYDEFHFSTDLITYIIESSVGKGHTNLRYMQRIAEDFSAKHITTVEAAKQYANQETTVYRAVIKSFGIRGRTLAPSEISFLKTWSDKMGFSAEMISEACDRTIRSIHEPSFGYANSILENWQQQGIRTIEDAEKADAVFLQNQKNKPARTGSSERNRFINFKQRDNDYEALQAQLIRQSMQ